MLVMLRSERGLTLIEIMIALAITGLLASAILFGRDNLQQQVKFAQATDQAVIALNNAETESYTTVGHDADTLSSVYGTSPSHVVYGKYVEFTDRSSVVNVYTVLALSKDCCVASTTIEAVTLPYSVTLPWGAKAEGDKFIVFGRGLHNSPQASTTTAAHASLVTLSGLAPIPATTPATVTLRSANGHQSIISIDSLGNVTRVVN